MRGRSHQNKEGRQSDGQEGKDGTEEAVGEVPQTDDPEAVGSGTDLADSDRVGKIGIVGPVQGQEVLVDAGEVAEAAGREEGGFESEEKVQDGINQDRASSLG